MQIGHFALLVPVTGLLLGASPQIKKEQLKPVDPGIKIRKLMETFQVDKKDLTHSGRSKFFVLEPNHKFELKSSLETKRVHVLKETRVIQGVTTRIVEEKSFQAGRIVRASREFYAIDRKTKDIYAFGREVELYANGKVASNEGSWMAGENGARIGMALPGNPAIGMYFRMANAPGVNQTEAKVLSLSDTTTAAGRKFTGVMRVEETSPMDKDYKVVKLYGQFTGIIRDGEMVRQQHVPDK